VSRVKAAKLSVNTRYSKGNFTVKDLAEEFNVSTRTIYRRLDKKYTEALPSKAARHIVVLMDTTYWGRKFGIVIMKDSIRGDVLWYKFIDRHERLDDYKEGVAYLETRGFTIQGIVSDGLKGLREMFPNYKYQLCQFHQVMTIKTKLTLRPKLEASKGTSGFVSHVVPHGQGILHRSTRRLAHKMGVVSKREDRRRGGEISLHS